MKMLLSRRILSNTSWLAVSEVSSRVIIFIGTAYLARVLGKAGFGLFSLSLAVGIYLWTVADMGVTGYGTREIARRRDQTARLYSTLNSLRFVFALALFMIFSGALYLIDMPLEKKLILSGGAFFVVASSLSSDWVFRGLERMEFIVFGRLATSLFFLAGIYLLVKSRSDTLLASVIYSGAFLAGTLVFMLILRRKLKTGFSLRLSPAEWWFHIKESFYFAANGIFNNLTIFIPIFFMGIWSTSEMLGVFSAPHRLTMILIRMGELIILALYPTLSSLYVSDRESFKKVHMVHQQLIIAVAVPGCIIGALFSKNIIPLFFGTGYAESVKIFTVLIWLTLLAVVRRTVGVALLSAGLQRINMIANGTGAAVVALSSVVLIPEYGGYGAAWALIAGEIFTLLIMSVVFKSKIYQSDIFRSYSVKVLFAGAVMGLLIISLPFSGIASAIIGILFYGLLSLSTGIVSRKTVQLFYHRMVGQKPVA